MSSTSNLKPSRRSRLSPWQEISFREVTYKRVQRSAKNLVRGTVKEQKWYIPTYPHIRRIYTLENDLRHHFGKRTFVVEEKVDGFNVRIGMIKGKIVALTRSGLPCPFTTEHVPSNISELIEDHQRLVVCAEVVGSNPYNICSLRYGKKTRLLVFDIIRKEKHPLKQPRLLGYSRRRELLEQYGIEPVREYGQFSMEQIDEIKSILLKLNREDREGLVFKEFPSLRRRIKYITAAASKEAIIQHLLQAEEPGVARFHDKFLLAAFFYYDMTKEVSEFGVNLGKELFETLETVIQQQEVFEILEIEISEEGWNEFRKMVRHNMTIRELERKKLSSGKILVKFKKIYPRSSSRIRELLRGKSVID